MSKNRHRNKASKKYPEKGFNDHHNKHEADLQSNVNSEEIMTPYFLKWGNPKTIFLLSLMFTATIYRGYQYINQQTQFSDTSNSNFTPNNSTVLCKTAIFYEVHQGSAQVKFVDKLLHDFKKHNYTTFLFEEPVGMTWEQNIERLSIGIENLKEVIHIPKELKESYIESFESTISLLNKIKELGLRYVAVDMDKNSQKKLSSPADPYNIKARDKFMADAINKACEKYQHSQVLIVGSVHGGVAYILKELGYKITSAFIIDHQPLYDPNLEAIGRGDNDIMLRTGNTEYMEKYGYGGMHIVNFYDELDNIEINITGLIEELGM